METARKANSCDDSDRFVSHAMPHENAVKARKIFAPRSERAKGGKAMPIPRWPVKPFASSPLHLMKNVMQCLSDGVATLYYGLQLS